MNKEDYKVYSDKMRKSIDAVNADFASVRAGRANASVLDRISVDYYGSPTPIQQIASVSTPDARSLLIQPWDASVLKGIEKAILASDLGLNPQNDGRTIRLIFPALTEERRRDLVKQVKKYGEEAKVAVRNIRRDAMDKFKAQKKKSEITEDDLKIIEKDLQKLTDDYIKEVERIADEKEKELMEI
jgi:ribosome recycling factor